MLLCASESLTLLLRQRGCCNRKLIEAGTVAASKDVINSVFKAFFTVKSVTLEMEEKYLVIQHPSLP